MAAGPTERTLQRLRREGWTAEVVERWIPQARRRRDLFGVVDVLALRGGETLAVQATSRSNVAARISKIRESDALPLIREAGWRIEVWGWARDSKGRWQVRVEDMSE
ncbi:hypothetical protein [Halorhodospira halophila]|uniref:hypothetical protein n=1 Tax=Halorhodospira halophila TaxID=1053 RepID=UPI0019127647|nr:hypothetical protein [Halorhodospira halophila]MBK5942730.1 hypothetical protein [Halorhodospira halophila]